MCQSEPLFFLCLCVNHQFLGYPLTSWTRLCLKFTSFDVTKGLALGSSQTPADYGGYLPFELTFLRSMRWLLWRGGGAGVGAGVVLWVPGSRTGSGEGR